MSGPSVKEGRAPGPSREWQTKPTDSHWFLTPQTNIARKHLRHPKYQPEKTAASALESIPASPETFPDRWILRMAWAPTLCRFFLAAHGCGTGAECASRRRKRLVFVRGARNWAWGRWSFTTII